MRLNNMNEKTDREPVSDRALKIAEERLERTAKGNEINDEDLRIRVARNYLNGYPFDKHAIHLFDEALDVAREAERKKHEAEKTFKEYRVCACDQVGNVLAQMQTCYSDDIPRVVNVIKENLIHDTINVDGLDFVIYERTVGNWKIINHVH